VSWLAFSEGGQLFSPHSALRYREQPHPSASCWKRRNDGGIVPQVKCCF
jgi:hypothetical protein